MAEEGLSCRKSVSGVCRCGTGVFSNSIEEIGGRVVAGVGRETVERFRENVVEDACLWGAFRRRYPEVGNAASRDPFVLAGYIRSSLRIGIWGSG